MATSGTVGQSHPSDPTDPCVGPSELVFFVVVVVVVVVVIDGSCVSNRLVSVSGSAENCTILDAPRFLLHRSAVDPGSLPTRSRSSSTPSATRRIPEPEPEPEPGIDSDADPKGPDPLRGDFVSLGRDDVVAVAVAVAVVGRGVGGGVRGSVP